MYGKGTEQQLGKMSHLLFTVTFLLIALSVLIVECNQERVCYYGQERDPKSEGKLRWIMPPEDYNNRCSCTRIKVGGVNPTFVDRGTNGASFTDQPLFTQDMEKIRRHFKCKVVTSTTKPSVATNGPPTTRTYPPSTTTEPPSTTTYPPTTPTEPQTATIKPGRLDCQALFDAGHNQSAVYNITPAQYPDGLEVYCDLTTDSKGWIVFQQRLNRTVNFTRSWAEYRDGFGDKEGEFWLGNEILRRLTEPVDGEQEWEMRVDLIVTGIHRSGVYADFHVDAENYTLHVGAFTDLTVLILEDALSTAPEPPSNGQPFSTYDRDNDAEPSLNCADELKGGWWFNRCTVTRDDFYDDGAGPHSNLNGEYSQRSDPWVYGRGIVWASITGRITHSEMKMRRVP